VRLLLTLVQSLPTRMASLLRAACNTPLQFQSMQDVRWCAIAQINITFLVIAAGAAVLAIALAIDTQSKRDAGKSKLPAWVPVLSIIVAVAVLYAIARWVSVRGQVNRKTALVQQRAALKSMSPEERTIEDQVSRTGFFDEAGKQGTGGGAAFTGAALGSLATS
jgi:hypothetical protein